MTQSIPVDQRVDEAIAKWLDAEALGQPLDKESFLSEHAAVADQLREFLDDHEEFVVQAEALSQPSKRMLISSVSTQTSDQPASPDQATSNHLLPQQFGGYELLEQIGRGGMGVIYRARQTSLDRVVAVKQILDGRLASDSTVKRFFSEAKSVAKLDHPGIVAIHDVGTIEGQHFFSMDYVDGQTLAQMIRLRPFTLEQSVRVIRAVCAAVHHAHSQGIVHRDLKPSNILIDRKGSPRVADFGLAVQPAEETRLTRTGEVVGSPSYMPPEQAISGNHDVQPSADIYSLGAVLYELLTGRPPFLASSAIETVIQVRNQEVVSPRLLNRQVSRDLETIVLKCLEKNPARRYESAAALADDLRAYQIGEPIKARRIGFVERSIRWCKRNRMLAFVFLLMSVGFFAVSLQWARAEYYRSQQRAATVRADQRSKDLEIANSSIQQLAEAAQQQADIAEQARNNENYALYIANMNLASQAVAQNNFRRAADLLKDFEGRFDHRDLRGFEWYYLWRKTHLQGDRYFIHGFPIRCISFDAETGTLVTSGHHDKIKVWDYQTGELRYAVGGDFRRILATQIDSKNQLLLAVTRQGKLLELALDTGDVQSITDLRAPNARHVAFSPDLSQLALGRSDFTIELVDLRTKESLGILKGHTRQIHHFAYSADGQKLASCALDRTIRLWDIETLTETKSIRKTSSQRAYSVAFSPDGRTLAAGCKRHRRRRRTV